MTVLDTAGREAAWAAAQAARTAAKAGLGEARKEAWSAVRLADSVTTGHIEDATLAAGEFGTSMTSIAAKLHQANEAIGGFDYKGLTATLAVEQLKAGASKLQQSSDPATLISQLRGLLHNSGELAEQGMRAHSRM